MSACNAAFKLDTDALACAMKEIKSLTSKCDMADLEELHERGLLPSGILNWLISCRCKVA